MKKYRFIRPVTVLFILFLFLILTTPVFSYDNDGVERKMSGGPHRTINRYAIENFMQKVQGDPLLSQYDFINGSELTGIAVTKPGAWLNDIQEGPKKGKWYQWVIEGGYSADEPESYMALRHFYDPMGANQGKEYLTDHIDEIWGRMYMGYNPGMDAKWWGALHSRYSISNGRNFMSAAFSATNRQEKEKLFVAAWRSLGETMHLLADMTVPAHVRNDSHPGASFEKYRADPYESRINQENVDDVHQNQVDPSLLQAIQSIPENQDGFLQVLQLFDIVAGYTNRNYFSLDTIAGVEKMLEQTITNANGMPEYPAPRLENQEVDENGYYYRTDYLGKLYLTRIQYQKQESLLEKVKYTPIPEVDEQCALSQAKRLVPAAIAGNEKLVEWFVPRIEIIIDSLTIEKGEDEIPQGVIQGRVIHTPSGMYDQPLLYSLPPDMPVKIVIDGKPYDLPAGAISIQQGVIEGTIAPMPEGTWKQVGLILDIGGLTVVSKGTPIASLELQPKVVEGTVGEAYGWYVQTIDAPSGVIYRWDLGDGTVEKTEEVSLTHVYSEEGQYRISVEMKDAKTGKTLATAIGKAIITPKPEPEETPTPEPIPTPEEFVVEETPTPEPTPSPAPTMNEEQRRQDILAEYRALYPQHLRAFHKFGRVEVIANADEVGPNQYHVAYKLWQIIEDGPRKGEEYEAVSLDLIFNLGQLEADLPIMRKSLGIEK